MQQTVSKENCKCTEVQVNVKCREGKCQLCEKCESDDDDDNDDDDDDDDDDEDASRTTKAAIR